VWAARLGGLGGSFEGVHLIFALGAKPSDIIQAIEPTDDVVILDTIRLIRIQDENSNAAINLALTPVIAKCRNQNQTLVLAHHTRKGAGEYGEAAAGGHAFIGLVDVALELVRDKNMSRRRIIRGWARVVEIPELVYEMDTEGNITVLGDPLALQLQEVKERTMETLGNEWQSTKEITEAIGDPRPSSDQILKALLSLAEEGLLQRDPPLADGKRSGKRYQWKLKT